MKTWWNNFAARVNAKTQRERLVIALLPLALVYSLFSGLLLMPLEEEKAVLRDRLTAAEQQMKKVSAQERVLAQALSNDPNAPKKREIEDLEARLAQIDSDLQTLATGLIAADMLPQALHDVLQTMGSLSLLGMETLAPSRLNLAPAALIEPAQVNGDDELPEQVGEIVAAGEQDRVGDDIGVFKHSVIVSLEGQYFDVIAYLRALEQLSWKIYWHAIDYQVQQYPTARVSIEVYTLSTEEGVLGV